jgi:DNA-binding IclR family transcriptional regulator
MKGSKGRPSKASSQAPTNYNAPALDKGLDILEMLAALNGPQGLPDLARRLERSKNELYRMVLVLERRGYIQRTLDDRYELTDRLFQLGMQTPPMHGLIDAALPLMHELSESLEQSCYLAVCSGDEIVVVVRVESPRMLGFAARVGYRRHAVGSASGVVLYGFSSDAVRKSWLISLRRTAPRNADFDKFSADAALAKRRGLAVVDSAVVSAVTDIAAPIFSRAEPIAVAALVLPLLARVDDSSNVAEASSAVVRIAETISHKLRNG